jgi:Ca-activated chloride channel family protein
MQWGSADLVIYAPVLLGVLLLLTWMYRARKRRLQRLADADILPVLLRGWQPRRARRRFVLWLAAVALIAVALARPQWGFQWQEVRQRGLDILVVLDTSRSMLAEDLKPSRLQQAKWGIRDLVKKLKGDRAGLVAFAGSSFLQCPLTIDYSAFLMTLEDVRVGLIPRGGTAIGQALRTAVDSFDPGTEADRLILLITDGEDHEGRPDALVDELKKAGIRVFAIGVGSRDGELIPYTDDEGHTAFFKDRAGQVVKTALKEDVLERLALGTDGVYIRATPGDLGIDRLIQQEWPKFKRRETDSKMIRAYEDRFQWFLGIALVLLVIEAALREWNPRPREAAP